ncbi:metalloprotease ATP23 [Chytriomyces sp. MP71]|nr:metalloprotease ATP23 [Chytriomyces sp. MP71]
MTADALPPPSTHSSWLWGAFGASHKPSAPAPPVEPAPEPSADELAAREKRAKQTAKEAAKCEKWKTKLLSNSAMVKFMMSSLDKVGCPFDESLLVCMSCDANRAGGFSPEAGIVLCQNKFLNRQHMEDTITHELVHAFDHCTTTVNWKSPIQHACAEIRAVNLSGECQFTRELRRGNFQIARHHQACVRRRAILGLKMLPGCEEGTVAEDAVRVAWDACFNDTAPFDEIP